MRILAAVVLLSLPLPAIEIATGKMLGSGYDLHSFYTRDADGPWRKTYSGAEFRPEAAGRLMNLRIGQAVVHDEWLTEEKFDPEANTDRVIAALDTWKRHGVIAISTSLQGANPAYELTKTIKRERAYSLGPKKGMLMSAFRPDGSLKPEWMGRVLRLARALNARGMVLHLIYFYQHQDEVLRDPAALRQAAINATGWLIENNLRNVIIEVANEIDVTTYDHNGYLRTNLEEMIRLIRSQFEIRKAGFRLPISTSVTGREMGTLPDAVRTAGDFVLLHGNNRTARDKGEQTAAHRRENSAAGAIVFSEDNNGRDTDAATLGRELASLDAIYDAGGSWGYMPWRQAQIFPFRIYDPFRHAGQDSEYFRRVLQHMRSRVFREPAMPEKLRLVIDEDFRTGAAKGSRLQDPGEFTAEGWKVTTERSQIRYDLGRFHAQGIVEVKLRGPLRIAGAGVKRNAVALWNEEAGADGDRKSQSFFQLRFLGGGMMLRLSNRAGGKSFEDPTGPLEWDENHWYTIRGEWNSANGENHLWRDGQLLKSGAFNGPFPGFRWVFIGKDNYQRFHSIPGVVYQSLKVWVAE